MGRLIDEDDVIRIVEFECGEWICLAKTIINGIKKIPCYVPDTNVGDTIYRQAAIEVIDKIFPADPMRNDYTQGIACGAALATEYIKQMPSAQPERDTPRKPTETTSRMWGIREKEPVCPKCGYYLGHWRFLGKRITYCEHCGQAIDWEGWDFDE